MPWAANIRRKIDPMPGSGPDLPDAWRLAFFGGTAASGASEFFSGGTGGSAHRLPNRGGWVEHGHHALFNLERFQNLGGYHDTFSEDTEFDRRLVKSGGRIWLADDLVITYFPRSNTMSLFRQHFGYGRGRARSFVRHGGRKRIRHFILPSIAPMVILGFLGSLYWPLSVPGSVWLFACLASGFALGINQRDICAAGSGDSSMVMQLAWSLGYWRESLSISAHRVARP